MANRLSEDPHVKVLVIEAGGKENLVTDIPLAAAMLQQTPIDWAYQTEPQEAACFGLINRVGGFAALPAFVFLAQRSIHSTIMKLKRNPHHSLCPCFQ
ncbi:glucose dehydrogenase [Caerostris darwini]|uniref:Glucose dehydrogenase n=1 Tax=Caerostris darwini TaxID=1538125 RepID=A0AAV4S9F7_9ARAC|nr:glucose dehydrogenase [Caerostris darwini]